jgi:hypothetical protein
VWGRSTSVFRRGRRHEALTGLSAPGVDEQPVWLPGKGLKPEQLPVASKVTLLRYDSPPWLADQELWLWRQGASPAPSPLRGVSTQEVLEALGTVFSPPELDWDLVGVTFVHAHAVQPMSEPLRIEILVDEPPSELHAQPIQLGRPAPARAGRVATPKKRRKWFREHDQIMAAVRDLSWEGYCSLIADIFRREGYEVFGGEGLDRDVIDMEVARGAERMLVNCQMRGLNQIGIEPLSEMVDVARRSGADGVFIILDGDFAPESWSMADGQALILIDGETLLGLVVDLTLGVERDRSFRSQLRRLLSRDQPRARQWAS